MEKEPRFRDFTAALGKGWLVVFSVSSVVFAVFALIPTTTTTLAAARIVCGFLAIACLWIAAYLVWKRERIARRVAERQLQSGFEFDISHEHAYLEESDEHHRYQHQRIALKNTGGVISVEKALVKLANIRLCPASISGRLPDVLRPTLVFGNHGSDPFPIHSGDPVLINVFTRTTDSLGKNERYQLWTTNPAINPEIEPDEYEIELIASGAPAQVERRTFKIGTANDRPYIRFV